MLCIHQRISPGLNYLDYFAMNDMIDPFDEIFFSRHGVGNNPVSKEEQNLKNALDMSQPTYDEIQFVRMFFKVGNMTDSYIKSFNYKGDEMTREGFNKAANRLMKRPRVLKYYNEMRQKLQDMEGEDLSNLINELNEDRKLARTLGQPGAAIQAVKTKANLLGLESPKSNISVHLDLTDDQRSKLLERIGTRMIESKRPVNQIEDVEYVEIENNE